MDFYHKWSLKLTYLIKMVPEIENQSMDELLAGGGADSEPDGGGVAVGDGGDFSGASPCGASGESDEGDRTSAGGGGDSLDLGGGEVRLLLEVLGKIWEGETSDGVGGEAHLTINVIGDRGLEVLARSCKRLRRLRIKRDADEDEDCLVSQRGLTALAQGCLELEYLAVYVSDITNASLEYIGTYSKNLCDFRLFLLDQEETITVLPLDNGVQALLRGGQKLRRFALYLRSGGLTDLGLSYVGQYSQNVRWMLLGYVGESDAGLLEFSKGCPSLQELEMRGCCFSERALADAVMQLTSLRYLWVQGYTVSATGRDLLAMARPFWNIELFPPRRIDVPDQQGEAHPPPYTCILLSCWTENRFPSYPNQIILIVY
ncbi:hypothetical protein FF1_041404 [Malus domestica]